MVSLVSPRDNLSMAQYHPRNPLDKSIVMHKGNQFFLIGNKKLEKISSIATSREDFTLSSAYLYIYAITRQMTWEQ